MQYGSTRTRADNIAEGVAKFTLAACKLAIFVLALYIFPHLLT
jgi:hypothetical protein